MAWEDRSPEEQAQARLEEIERGGRDDDRDYIITAPGFRSRTHGIINAELIAAKFPGATISPKGATR